MRLVDLLVNMRLELHTMLTLEERNALRAITDTRMMGKLFIALYITGRVHEAH